MLDKVYTAQGSPNIALVKYWGKRNERLILPQNSSISLTLSSDILNTTTSAMLSKKIKKDMFYLDGKLQNLEDKEIRERFGMVDSMRDLAKVKENILIVSKNNFPAGSGMASSASGIATLAYVLNGALGLDLNPRDLSIIARQGSGSACRSIFGGLVVWHRGSRADGKDSYAEQEFDESYWPDLIDNIVVVSQEKKKVSSRAGMRQTVETNPLFRQRPPIAEGRVEELIYAYRQRNFDSMAELIMADSNEMHALMLSTRPSIRYLNNNSFKIMDAIENLNEEAGGNVAAYTFDAGPNANIITLSKYKDQVFKALKPLQDSKDILYIKTSGVGEGPRMLDDSDSLIEQSRLSPK
ncbi:MAG: diphosphomevalonate decarboxylase [Candidatus Micrarchaeota archaeon]|nr:diphosphomevalonate decarboxylase [Candidatus Micrarchaeota archaeon]MDE1859492.1 diphosphomevalonate decarboxylase [Candidatus Micrarchaeota archaeon]